jgi:Spy/CpxP family protein refolding chaperone
MKAILKHSLALAILASSISAFAAAAPAKEDPPKEEKASMTCSPVDASSQQMADQHSKRDKQMEKKTKKMEKDQDQKQPYQDHSLLGIYG